MKSISTQSLQNYKSLKIESMCDLNFTNVLPAEACDSRSLVFVSSPDMLQTALLKNVCGFIILEKIYSSVAHIVLNPDFKKKYFVATTPNIQWAMSEILILFDKNQKINSGIHSTAQISPSAKIGKNVLISPYAVIEDFAVIEDHVSIGAHTVIEHHAIVKEKTILSTHVFVGSYSEIGKNCKLSSHVVIGSDGFGYFTDKNTDKNLNHHKIAQIGNVVLEDNVELGAHCAVDRATLAETRIKSGSKLDNHCHIAHNCVIGENAAIAAGFIVAGSTVIGKNFMSSGGVGVLGHLKIADNVILTARAGVVQSIEKPGLYGGFPAIPQNENLKIMATLSHLPKIKKQILQIIKHLGLDQI